MRTGAPAPARTVALGLALLLAAAACAVGPAGPTASALDLTLATGVPGGAYAAVGEGLRDAVSRYGRTIRMQAEPSSGSVESIRRLIAGEVDVALAQCDVLFNAYQGRGEFTEARPDLRVLAVLYPEVLHVVARKGLGARTLADLRGRRVAFGPEGSGGAATAWAAFDAHRLSPRDVQTLRCELAEAVEAFRRGEVDAFVTVAGAPSPLVADALAADGALVPLDPAAAHELVRLSAYFHLGALPRGTYGLAEEVSVLEVDAALVAGGGITDDTGQELVDILFHARRDLEDAHPAMGRFDPAATSERAPVPIQTGALRVLEREGAVTYPVQVYTGLYVYSITELDLSSGTFLFDGYIWFRWKGPLLGDDALEFTLPNGTIESIDDPPVIRHRGWRRQSRRITARLRANFVLYDYPFDTQRLPLVIEHRWQGDDKLVFVPDDGALTSGDVRRSFLSDGVQINDWQIVDAVHREERKAYETDFGSIEKGVWDGRSSRYVFEVEIRRSLVPYLVKSVVPLVLIVLMSFCVFFISAKEFEVQAAIVITALLSCVAFHISQADSLPEVGYLVTADKFFLISYVVIFLALVEVVIENAVFHRGRLDLANRLDQISRVLFPALFFAPIAYLLLAGR